MRARVRTLMRTTSRLLSLTTRCLRVVLDIDRWSVLCRGGAAGVGGILGARATIAQAVCEWGRDAELLAVILVHPLSRAQR